METDKKDNGFVAISISGSDTGSKKYYCNLCSCNLTMLDEKAGEFWCTRCNVSYFPNKGEKVKRANKFETPHKEDKVLVSMVEDSPTAQPRKSVFPRSLESLKRTGVTITGFNSTVDNEGL